MNHSKFFMPLRDRVVASYWRVTTYLILFITATCIRKYMWPGSHAWNSWKWLVSSWKSSASTSLAWMSHRKITVNCVTIQIWSHLVIRLEVMENVCLSSPYHMLLFILMFTRTILWTTHTNAHTLTTPNRIKVTDISVHIISVHAYRFYTIYTVSPAPSNGYDGP